jgi:hypothetical protein
VATNAEAVIQAAFDEWGQWQQAFDDPPIQLRVHVLEGHVSTGQPPAEARPPASIFRADRHLFAVAADAHNFATGDTRARLAAAWLTTGAVEDRPYFIYHFLDALAYPLITSLNFTPIHAGCVAREGRAVLLCGDSKSGKSSLAYACARRGWTYVSDDASPLLRRSASARIVIGGPHRMRLRPDARELFPELAPFEPAIRGNGKLSLQIPTRELSIATAPCAAADSIVLLHRFPRSRSDSPARPLARLQPIEKPQVREHCEKWFYRWDPPVHHEQQTAFEDFLSGVRTFSLEYSDLDAAIDALDPLGALNDDAL